jgi:hypothetical protein
MLQLQPASRLERKPSKKLPSTEEAPPLRMDIMRTQLRSAADLNSSISDMMSSWSSDTWVYSTGMMMTQARMDTMLTPIAPVAKSLTPSIF